MRLLRTWIVLLLTLGWAPLNSHCSLEALPGLEFLRCCDSDHVDEDTQGDPCEDRGCCALESAKYRAPRPQECLAPQLDSCLLLSSPEPDVCVLPLPQRAELPHTDPPDLPGPWQFRLRTASPPRAPTR